MRLIFLLLLIIIQITSVLVTDLEQIQHSKILEILVHSRDNSQDHKFQKTIFIIQQEDKNKKKAYEEILFKYQSIVNQLRKSLVLPDQRLIYAKKIETKMNKKRKIWIFIRVISMISRIQQKQLIESLFQKFHVKSYRHLQLHNMKLHRKQKLMKAVLIGKENAINIINKINYQISNIKITKIMGDDDNLENAFQKIHETKQYKDQELNQIQSFNNQENESSDESSNSDIEFPIQVDEHENMEVKIRFELQNKLNDQENDL